MPEMLSLMYPSTDPGADHDDHGDLRICQEPLDELTIVIWKLAMVCQIVLQSNLGHDSGGLVAAHVGLNSWVRGEPDVGHNRRSATTSSQGSDPLIRRLALAGAKPIATPQAPTVESSNGGREAWSL